MTSAKEHADEALRLADHARTFERYALAAPNAHTFVADAQASQRCWIGALEALLRFVNALPEPIAVPPVPQPSEEAKRRGLLVGAIVRDHEGTIARVVSHGSGGHPLLQIGNSYVYGVSVYKVTLVRPAPVTREPNAESVRRRLYIGARVYTGTAGLCDGEIIAWDGDGDPVVEPANDLYPINSWPSHHVTLAGDES